MENDQVQLLLPAHVNGYEIIHLHNYTTYKQNKKKQQMIGMADILIINLYYSMF